MTKNKTKEERISQIINAAIKEFMDKGYENASMESISKRAKLSKGGVYYHFNSKEELLLAANKLYTEQIYKIRCRANRNLSSAQGIKNYFYDYLEYWIKNPQQLEFFFLSHAKIISNKLLWSEMDSYFNKTVDFFEKLLINGLKRGEFIDHNTKARAIALTTSLDGITGYLIMCKDLDFKQIAQYYTQLYIDEIIMK
ncbi:MAG: TetR/AcrR family transcriptional regulator [Spirochaetes bacterium]|nr:TetR/AcrR family transcriptional regulator [Spirochaetota bacterium]